MAVGQAMLYLAQGLGLNLGAPFKVPAAGTLNLGPLRPEGLVVVGRFDCFTVGRLGGWDWLGLGGLDHSLCRWLVHFLDWSVFNRRDRHRAYRTTIVFHLR
jgi:hypothetical protein